MQKHKEKIIAALLAFFIGEWGIHRFYLDEQEAGKKYLIWCVVGLLTSWLVIGLFPLVVLFVKKIIDGFNYLLMPDDEFDDIYNKKALVTEEQLKGRVKSEEYNIIDIKFPFERNYEMVLKRPKVFFEYEYEPEHSDEFVVCASMDEALEMFKAEGQNDAEALYSGKLPVEYNPDGSDIDFLYVGFKNDGRRRFYLYRKTI